MTLEEVRSAIVPPDRSVYRQAQVRLDRLTKPPGSLGRLEELAADYAASVGRVQPEFPRAAVFTFAADHGIADEGVSAYPREVTAQMVFNFLRGGAGINVLAAHVGAEVRIVDIGVAFEFPPLPGLIPRKIAPGTGNFLHRPAMTRSQAMQALEVGIALAREAAAEGFRLLATGDMGIGNTSSSTAIAAVMTAQSVASVTGRGTGINDHALARARHNPNTQDPLDVLSKVGGFEIAGIAGLILGGAVARIPVVLDGFISGAAALIAVGLAPACRDYVIASHQSVECGHGAILSHLQLKPLLDLGLRLGEGTGACLGISLIHAALKLYTQMATFEEAAVSGPSRAGDRS